MTLMICLVFLIFSIIVAQSILMISASDYIAETEVFLYSNKKSYLKYIKINIQKLVKSIAFSSENRISKISFINNLIAINAISAPLVLIIANSFGLLDLNPINEMKSLKLFYFGYTVLIVYISRLINFISNDFAIDINKMVLKTFVSITLIILNYGFVAHMLPRLELFGAWSILIKIVLFLNTAITVYVFDNFSKHKKNRSYYQNKLLDKILLLYIMFSAFLMLNNEDTEVKTYKLLYYSFSIYLIDFLVGYFNKMMGYVKMSQTLKFSYETLFIYYLVSNLLILGIEYVN